ncbi:MAG: LicD family protein [Bacteroidales bacterium]|nr:LicD family protein [Bacteroidales bacterium]
MAERKELTQDQLKKMQQIEVEMADELDRVCRKHNIRYSLDGGSMLGAVRHKGFIPWDDDMDFCMLREDYEKFKKVANELNPDICFFQDHDTDPYYRWGYAKLRRIGTTYVRLGQEHMKYKTGIAIDIFPLDDVPKSICGQMLQDFYCFCIRKILWSEAGKQTAKGIKWLWFCLLSRIPSAFVFNRVKKMADRSNSTNDNRVRVLLYPANGVFNHKLPIKERWGMPKKWFKELKEYDFEGRHFWGVQDYNAYLSQLFGDYMTPPPPDKRVSSIPFSSIDFGNL